MMKLREIKRVPCSQLSYEHAPAMMQLHIRSVFKWGLFFFLLFFLLGKQLNASSSQNEWLVMAGADVEEECFFLLPYGS